MLEIALKCSPDGLLWGPIAGSCVSVASGSAAGGIALRTKETNDEDHEEGEKESCQDEDGEGICNGLARVTRLREGNFSLVSSKQNHAFASLGHTVIGCIKNLDLGMVSKVPQFRANANDAFIKCQSRDILHHDCARHELAHEMHEMEDQLISLVILRKFAVERGHRGKALTGRTAGEEIEITLCEFQPSAIIRGGDILDFLGCYLHVFVIRAIGFNCKRIAFDRAQNFESGFAQTLRKSAATRE